MTLFATIPPEFWAALIGFLSMATIFMQWLMNRGVRADVLKGNVLTEKVLTQSKANSAALQEVRVNAVEAAVKADESAIEAKEMRKDVQQIAAELPDKPRLRFGGGT